MGKKRLTERDIERMAAEGGFTVEQARLFDAAFHRLYGTAKPMPPRTDYFELLSKGGTVAFFRKAKSS